MRPLERVAVVIPAYSEEALIESTLRSIPDFVERIVLIDDASPDRTIARAEAVGDPRLQIKRLSENSGAGAAIAEGYRLAFEGGAAIACVMAGDNQMDPDDLRPLLVPILEGRAEYIVGDRLSHPSAFRAMPLSRFIGNHILSALSRLLLGLPIRDSQSGYTALSREGYERLDLARLFPRYGYPNDLLGLARLAGLRIENIPVRPRYGEEESGIRLHHALIVIPAILVRARLRLMREGGARLLPSASTASTKAR